MKDMSEMARRAIAAKATLDSFVTLVQLQVDAQKSVAFLFHRLNADNAALEVAVNRYLE